MTQIEPDKPPIGQVSREALTRVESPLTLQSLLAAMLLVALFVANLTSLRAFVVVVVGVVGLWAWDLTDTAGRNQTDLNPLPVFAGVAAAAWGSYRWGFEGLAVATAVTVAVAFGWAIFRPTERTAKRLSNTALASLLAALSTGPLILLRMRTETEVTAYVIVMVVALVTSEVARQFQHRYPLFDANLAALAAAAAAGLVVGAAFSELSLSATFVAAVASAGGIVAGQTAGSLLRTGHISLLQRAPGALPMMDGILLASAIFWLAIITLST